VSDVTQVTMPGPRMSPSRCLRPVQHSKDLSSFLTPCAEELGAPVMEEEIEL
jgi:hypothetical protein